MSTLELRLAIYAGILVVVGGWLAYERTHLIDEGEYRELAKLKKSSDALLVQANAKIKQQDEDHKLFVANNEGKLDAALQTNTVLSDSLDQRVRDFNAYRRQHPDVPRPAGGPPPAGGGECGARSCGELAVQLAQAGDELTRSNGELVAALQAAQRDRDSLNGLPR